LSAVVSLFFLLLACSIATRVPVATVLPGFVGATGAPSATYAAAGTTQPAVVQPPAGVRPLELTAEGAARTLPQKLLGASVEAMIEHILDDPAKIAAIGQTAPGVIRFPGGSQSNYYNWRTGLLEFSPQPNSSAYYKFWSGVAPKIARAFPGGVHMEQYQSFATQIHAEVILVPNLETSSVSEQVAWFTQLAADHALPQYIELGNEFWVAMGNDPNVIHQWPDEPTSLAVMKQYEQALRPIVGPGAKFAVQSAGASFTIPPGATSRFDQRLLEWDAALAPADWFQAVTIHLYPNPGQIIQQAGNPGPEARFSLFMGRADAGVDRALADLAARMPGKEIWITEWSPTGGNFSTTFSNPDLISPQMAAQLVARETLAILRHPQVTRSLYFTLNADPTSPFQEYVSDSQGNYLPMPVAMVLEWFNQAANSGSTFQRMVDQGSQPVTGLGEFSESYRPVEGGLFRSASSRTLILQNASADSLWYDPSQQGQESHPDRVDLLVEDQFSATAHAAAQVTSLDPGGPLVIPPYSLVRLVWNSP
jgi:hypothetical protein